MSKVLIVGSIGLDTLETPHGTRDNVLGGSVSYASVASSLFSKTGIVGVVGKDFAQEHFDLFNSRSISIEGLEITDGETFKWSGFYEKDMNQAHTRDTQLNVFADFNPILPESYKESEFIFLANIHPSLQLNILNQVKSPKFVICDTMNLWIDTTKAELTEVIKKVDLMLMNEGEARQYCGTSNLVQAAQHILTLGPKYVIIKKGEHGALLFSKDGEAFVAPAFPLDMVKDPTGAGDTFAGGFIGHLASETAINSESLRRSIVVGSAMASFTAQDFSLDRLKTVTAVDLEERYSKFTQLTSFGELNLDKTPVSQN